MEILIIVLEVIKCLVIILANLPKALETIKGIAKRKKRD